MRNPKTLSYRQRWDLLSARCFGVMWRMRNWLGLQVYGIYVRDLMRPSEHAPSQVAGFTHRIFEAHEMPELLALIGNPDLDISEAFVRRAFAKGDACDTALMSGQLVSYTWMAFTPTYDAKGVFVSFGDEHRYAYKAYTLPEHRGQRALRLFKTDSDGYCLQRGKTKSISFITIDNQSSIRHATGVGNRRVGFAGYWRVGPAFVPFRTAGVRRERFRFFVPRP